MMIFIKFLELDPALPCLNPLNCFVFRCHLQPSQLILYLNKFFELLALKIRFLALVDSLLDLDPFPLKSNFVLLLFLSFTR
jgi:hypothetical protein